MASLPRFVTVGGTNYPYYDSNFNKPARECCCDCSGCCDCTPSTLDVVISGTGTDADGTWELTYIGNCQWKFQEDAPGADVWILATKTDENMALIAKDFGQTTTYFDADQTTEHYTACKHLDYTITDGGESATVEGTCTPTCDAEPCAEAFDPSTDTPPCTPNCCPSCISPEYSVTLSGITSCVGTCCTDGISSVKITALTITSATFTMARTADADCQWYNSNVGNFGWEIYINNNCSGPPFTSGTTTLEARLIGQASFQIKGTGPVMIYFTAAAIPCGENMTLANGQSVCCIGLGSLMNVGHSGTATLEPC